MPTVSVERLPVQLLGLGFLGFDHLQIVLRNGAETEQGHWFVIEGVRDADEMGVWLGVEGWDGGTTLSDANGGLIGEDLLRKDRHQRRPWRAGHRGRQRGHRAVGPAGLACE